MFLYRVLFVFLVLLGNNAFSRDVFYVERTIDVSELLDIVNDSHSPSSYRLLSLWAQSEEASTRTVLLNRYFRQRLSLEEYEFEGLVAALRSPHIQAHPNFLTWATMVQRADITGSMYEMRGSQGGMYKQPVFPGDLVTVMEATPRQPFVANDSEGMNPSNFMYRHTLRFELEAFAKQIEESPEPGDVKAFTAWFYSEEGMRHPEMRRLITRAFIEKVTTNHYYLGAAATLSDVRAALWDLYPDPLLPAAPSCTPFQKT